MNWWIKGLLENDDELWATEKEGQWPGHAAIVALANLLKVNIAVIQGNFFISRERSCGKIMFLVVFLSVCPPVGGAHLANADLFKRVHF